jgi:thioredoxin 1
MIDVTGETFESEVMQSAQPVVVDFWAPWCGPCKMLSPVLADIEKEFAGQAKFAKINVDEPDVSDIAARYGIRGVPSLLLFKNGEVVSTLVGMHPRTKLAAWLMTNL